MPDGLSCHVYHLIIAYAYIYFCLYFCLYLLSGWFSIRVAVDLTSICSSPYTNY